jgi:hypothetical protein
MDLKSNLLTEGLPVRIQQTLAETLLFDLGTSLEQLEGIVLVESWG